MAHPSITDMEKPHGYLVGWLVGLIEYQTKCKSQSSFFFF